MGYRIATIGSVVLVGIGVTMLWPRSTVAAARAEHAPVARERPDVVIHGSAECVKRVAGPLRIAYYQPLTFATTSDADALHAVSAGIADAALVATAGGQALPDPNLREIQLGDFVVALVRHAENPVQDITRAQLEALCGGGARGWQDLGGRGSDLHAYSAFAEPADEARALGAAQGLAVVRERGLTVADVIARVQHERLGLGLIVVRDVPETLPCLAIDGVAPSATAFAAGTYPLGYRVRLVHRAEHRPPVAALLAFLTGDAGQRALQEQ